MLPPKINHIVILTGAGISAESGIKTFRDSNGLWENHSIEEVASPQGFMRNPKLVYDFYNKRRAQLFSEDVSPNDGHKALAQLEKEFPGKITLITQNVDNLHERGGSQSVWHMHGELTKMRCQKSGSIYEAPFVLDHQTKCECCQKTESLRPHIVWFGEIPFYLDEAFEELSQCDLFLSIGTSGLVYPAAQFVSMTSPDCYKMEINIVDTQVSPQFDECRTGPSGKVLPKLVEEILNK